MRLAAALALAFATAGCMAGMGYSTADQVTNAAREYNQDVHWGRYDKAAEHIPREERPRQPSSQPLHRPMVPGRPSLRGRHPAQQDGAWTGREAIR
jgi:hypothetical protein